LLTNTSEDVIMKVHRIKPVKILNRKI